MRERTRWIAPLRHTLLAIGIAVVAVCVVSMHQLSSDHTLATGEGGSHAHGAALTSTVHERLQPRIDHPSHGVGGAAVWTVLPGETMPASGVSLVSAGLMSAGIYMVTAEWGPISPSGDGDGCAGCASHLLRMATCLMALTLVVGARLLRPPTVRLMAWAKARPMFGLVTGRARSRPALSLVELSLRRT